MTPRTRQPEIGQRLAAARLQRGLAQKEVARSAGVAASYLSRIENGKVQPTFKLVMQVVGALGADLAEIAQAPPKSSAASRGPCPVTNKGHCLLDLIGPTSEGGRYTPRTVRLLRKFAGYVESAEPTRLRAMEILLEDLAQASKPTK